MTPKLSQLTHQDKIKLAAELDRRKLHAECDHEGVAYPSFWRHDNDEVALCYKDSPEDFATSYDAIIPLIQKQNGGIKFGVEDYIELVMGSCYWYDATPHQLLDAILVATGKAEL